MDLKIIKELGFESEEELQLYRDVCAIEFLYDDETIFSKNDFEQYISKHRLSTLFDEVKDMSELNRLVEIYMYYYNMDMGNPYNLATELIESIKAKSNISPREYIAKIEERKMMEQEQEQKLNYIVSQACLRLGEGVFDFYGIIDERIDNANPVNQAIEKILRRK